MTTPPPLPPAGLCGDCRWAAVHAAKAASYLRCRRAETDPLFPRYPRLPVVACAGYEPGGREPLDPDLRAR